MTQRSDLTRAVRDAQDGRSLAQAVAALDQHDVQRTAQLNADRELDLGARIAARRLTPAALHEHHTAATDWLSDVREDNGDGYRTAMIAEASTWYRRLDPAVRADGEELGQQAIGRARTLASRFDQHAPAAEREFLQVVSYLQAQAASGLPQIDQTTDPNNAPGPTPYPAEVFPTFGEEQDPFNGVETNAHGSGAASTGAPMLQQVMQQDGSGSGFGGGPEKPDEHDTAFDASNSYAEVPLGTPGQIPAAPGQGAPAPSSAPNPVAGTDQDEGADKRQAVAAIQGYSYPDPYGYRWGMTAEVMHPFHERCAAAHWPDEACGDRVHTASVAIAYQADLDTMRRQAACERIGVQEGLRAIAAAATIADLGAHHNRLAAGWNSSGRTAEDTAVLHGFFAVVRPVLAEAAHEAALPPRTAANGLAGGGGVTESEREHASHHLPGTDKFPVDSAADVQNAKHDIGRTSEPKGKVVNYINEMAREYHVAPVGHEKSASYGRSPNFREGASALTQVQQVTDPDNVPSPEDDELPEGVAFPIDPAFAAQWVTGPGGAQPQQQRQAARADEMPQDAAESWGASDARNGRSPIHKDKWNGSAQRHGDYARNWGNTTGLIHGLVGKGPMSKDEFGKATGRADLHKHYLEGYASGRTHSRDSQGLYAAGGLQRQADTWSQPHQTTDDLDPPCNSAATTPPMTQPDGDLQAGMAAGKADKAAGSRPAFADNSSGVSPYVKGYAQGYGGPSQPQGAQDVPYSMGGDSGQAANSAGAQQAFQVARASRRVSAAFAPDALLVQPDFRKGYLFATWWKQGSRLVGRGTAEFEAGLYAGITDAGPAAQKAWRSAHAAASGRHPDLRQRMRLHASFTRKAAARSGLRAQGAYLRQAGTTTDLVTDGPGSSPDPMGSTPLNGPGTPPPMGGMDNASAPGEAPPYQGAPPLPGGPVAPDDVMGRPQQAPQANGPFTNTFSGNHPENADLAPVAPNSANQPGYSNKDAYKGDPSGGDRVARLAAFRSTVQAGLARMGERQ
ncbi:MAG: hypothetical protein JWM19_884 [Actinomycetia bacterium]|nr:hypothetical protein [Actinomycetes bacterium]